MKNTLAFMLLMLFAYTQSLGQTEGNAFFGAPVVHTLKFTFPYANYVDSLTYSYDNDVYIKCTVEVDDTLYADCGVKWKGNSSYTVPGLKKSFKIDFNKFVSGQNLNGLKKLNLNNNFKDPSFLREKIMLDFLVNRSIPAPRCTYVEVYINGTLWGLYTGVEEVDKTFLNRWFGDKKGNLFKGDPTGDLKWLGSTPSTYYTKYELKTNTTANDWTDLVELINRINNTPLATYSDSLNAFFDTEKYMYTWASHVLFANLDSYLGSGHNYYLYHDSTANVFRFISWDVNEAFGNFNMGMTVSQLETMAITYIPMPTSNRPLHQKMLANGYQPALYNAVCDLINYDYTPWYLNPIIDSISTVIRPYVYADPNKFYSNTNFEDNINADVTIPGIPGGGNVPGIKSFIQNRRNALVTEMAANGCAVGISDIEKENGLMVFPNPANTVVNVQLTSYQTTNTYVLVNAWGQMVQQGTFNFGKASLNVSALPQGLYFLRVNALNSQSILISR